MPRNGIQKLEFSGILSFPEETSMFEPKNRNVVILGKNDSGKSNVIKIISKISDATTGNNETATLHISSLHLNERERHKHSADTNFKFSIHLKTNHHIKFDGRNLTVFDRDIPVATNRGSDIRTDSFGFDQISTHSDQTQINGIFKESIKTYTTVTSIDKNTNMSSALSHIKETYEDTTKTNWPSLEESLIRAINAVSARTYRRLRISGNTIFAEPDIKGKRFEVDTASMGDGVASAVTVFATLNQIKSCNIICIEEPEQNMHPSASMNIIREFEKQYQSSQIIITTHSHTLIDLLAEDNWCGAYVWMKNGESKIKNIDTDDTWHRSLNEMGVRPSQMFGAACVVWVEGPSDVNYIRTMIDIAKPHIRYGIDYTFCMYGGSLLANYDSENPAHPFPEESLVVFEKVHPNNIVVCDMDGRKGANLKNAIKNIQSQENTSTKVVLTHGREIEHMVQPSAIVREFDSHSIKGGTKYTFDLAHNANKGSSEPAPIENTQFSDKLSFAKAMRALARPAHDPMQDDARKIQNAVNNKKNPISADIRARAKREGLGFNDVFTARGRTFCDELAKAIENYMNRGHNSSPHTNEPE